LEEPTLPEPTSNDGTETKPSEPPIDQGESKPVTPVSPVEKISETQKTQSQEEAKNSITGQKTKKTGQSEQPMGQS
ncbi:TPA: hypothetical protein ACF0SI_002890, partial [Enterococcus hirae]